TTIDQYPEPPTPPEAVSAGWLADCWKDRDELAKGNPPPQAVSPHLWTAYQQTLLRCDELVSAGRKGDAEQMREQKLKPLETQIKLAIHIELTSIDNSLAMRRAFGNMPRLDPELRARFEQVLADPKKRGELQNKEFRAPFCEWLLDWVVGDAK